jgi:Skp family chaperone for outer membrane proteins
MVNKHKIMLASLKRNLFPFLIAFSALSVSASAAFYSVTGLSKLFAGASFEVLIMAASLEVAKLVIASLLYQYWDTLNKWLRTYLMVAAMVLVFITSMGIYGFLSAAYQETATKMGNIDAQVELIETKRDNLKDRLAVYTEEKKGLNEAMSELRTGLSNNVIQYKDRETGEIITTTSSATRKALEKQLDQAISRQDELNSRIDEVNEEIFKYESEIVELETSGDVAGELGPLKYLSGLTGIPMDQIINYLLLVIIFVFDPLAISLVVAANFAFDRANPKRHEDEPLPSRSIWDGIEEELDERAEMFMNDVLPEEEDEWDGDDEWDEDDEEWEPNNVLKNAARRYHEHQEYAEDFLVDTDKELDELEELEFDMNQDELEEWTKLADELAEGSQALDDDKDLLAEYQETKAEDREQFFDEEHALDMVLNDMVEQLDEEDLKELEAANDSNPDETEVETTDRTGTFPNENNPTSVGSIVQKINTTHLPQNETSAPIYKRNPAETVENNIPTTPKLSDDELFDQAMREKAEKEKLQFLKKNGNQKK